MNKPTQKTLHEIDFHAWCYVQASLISSGKFEELDILNLVEELESIAWGEKNDLKNHFAEIFFIFLKRTCKYENIENNWKDSIDFQRERIKRILEKSPTLKSSLFEVCEDGYREGRRITWEKTDLDPNDLPEKNPFPYPDFLQDGWLPE